MDFLRGPGEDGPEFPPNQGRRTISAIVNGTRLITAADKFRPIGRREI
jgi:hypothetical protein